MLEPIVARANNAEGVANPATAELDSISEACWHFVETSNTGEDEFCDSNPCKDASKLLISPVFSKESRIIRCRRLTGIENFANESNEYRLSEGNDKNRHVNGPGEMADADYGYVGAGQNKITLYRGKEVVKRNVPTASALDELIEIIKEDGHWVDVPD